MVEQALQGHPADWSVLVVSQTVVVHREQVSGQGVVTDLHLHAVVNTTREEGRTRLTFYNRLYMTRIQWVVDFTVKCFETFPAM